MLILQGVICYDSPPKKVVFFSIRLLPSTMPGEIGRHVRQQYEVDSLGGGFKRFFFFIFTP